MARFKLPLALFLGTIFMASPLWAAEPETTKNLELAGISFDDPPLRLPVTPALQQAMNQIAGDLGKHCGTQEAYGWRVQQTEQQRVNDIFSSAATKLGTAGYNLAPQTPPSATRDITIFLAQRPAEDLLFLWSAGELGLVLLVCDAQNGVTASESLGAAPDAVEPVVVTKKPSATTKKPVKPKPVTKSKAAKPSTKPAISRFSPVGDAPAAIAVDDLPPVVRETTTAAPIPPAPAKETIPPSPQVTPEVKAMLESLPESPPTAPAFAEPTASTPPEPLPLDIPAEVPANVPTMIVPPTPQ